MNTSAKQPQNNLDTEYEHKPITTHISCKQHDKNPLAMEQRLMNTMPGIEAIFTSISSGMHTTLWDTFFNKIDKATREKKELLINHLVTERNKIEDACGSKPHDDIKKAYNMITRTIAELKMEVFMIDYSDHEEILNELLGIGRSSK